MSVSVSIIVPCYNVAAYLDQCMESLAGQSMEDIEIICVNDGSSDRTAEILREWRDRDGRVRVIDRKNSGVSAARNSGMEAAGRRQPGFSRKKKRSGSGGGRPGAGARERCGIS